MPGGSKAGNKTTQEASLGLAVAREELGALEKLANDVVSKIKRFSNTKRFDGKIDNTEFALHQNRHSQLKAYEELAHACYGRTVIGTEVDEREKPKGQFIYRITQANVGFIGGDCVVVARNSPLATALVTALPSDDREVTTGNRDRYLTIGEVRVFDGPVSLLSHAQLPNFRSATVRQVGTKRPIILRDLRSILSSGAGSAAQRDEAAVRPAETAAPDAEPGWLADWSEVYLPDTDEASLGHQFFIQTTVDQERALNNPRGLTFVEGIAGSGKTSVALGRLKFFANFATGEREYYGLQNAPEGDFSPIGMVGFVRSPSLKRYLKDTAAALGLERLLIRDFEEFRIDMCGRFGISDRFKRNKDDVSLIRSRINWLRALDAALARAAASQLRKNLVAASNVPPTVTADVAKIVGSLFQAESNRSSNAFNLDSLAARLTEIVADAELRSREEKIRDEFQVRQTVEDERYRRERASLEREMRLLQQQSEKKIVSPLIRALLAGITAHDLIYAAVSLEEFPKLVRAAFGPPTEGYADAKLHEAVAGLRQSLSLVGGRSALGDTDLVNLVIMAAMIADGFDYSDQKNELSHLHQMRGRTAVFIDEIQDFAENEIFLMGMTASPTYHQVTLSGDRKQRLQSAGSDSYEYLFPKVPKSYQNRPFFLDHNFRQRAELAAFSSGFRLLIQNDSKVVFQSDELSKPLRLLTYTAPERMADYIERQIRSIPKNATIAVIAPSLGGAESWFKLLEDELASGHRPPRLSHRDDLTRRVNVHFTEVRETKGLEFDVVIIPDFGAFSLESEIGRNEAYVAISRPRHSIILGCRQDGASRPEIDTLVRSNLIRIEHLVIH